MFQQNISLSKYTSFKIGGNAKYFFISNNSDELSKAITDAQKKKMN